MYICIQELCLRMDMQLTSYQLYITLLVQLRLTGTIFVDGVQFLSKQQFSLTVSLNHASCVPISM